MTPLKLFYRLALLLFACCEASFAQTVPINVPASTVQVPASTLQVPVTAPANCSVSGGASITVHCSGGNISPSGTVITALPVGQTITDASLTLWTLQAGVVFAQPSGGASAPAGFSANVIAVAYVNGTIYQENTACQWFAWNAVKVPPWTLQTVAPIGAPPAPVCPVKPPAVAGIKISGNKIVSTVDGSPFTVIGGTVSGFESDGWVPQRSAVIAAQTSAWWKANWPAQHAGTNAVRFHIDACSYLADKTCAPGTDGLNASQVQQAVKNVRAAGFLVDLVESISAPNGQQSIGQPGWPDADHSIAFWKSLADTFGSDAGVIFEPFNEPFGANNFNQWGTTDIAFNANGGSYTPFMHQNNKVCPATGCNSLIGGGAYSVAGEKQILQTIRAEGAINVVLVSPVGWAGEIEYWLAANVCASDPQKNCGASQHAYGYSGGNGPITAVLNAGFAVVETEFFGPTVGNIGSTTQVLAMGVSGLMGCGTNDSGCSNAWNNTSITVNPW